MMKNIAKDEKGVVLILVLIVLVAAIIIGVTVVRSSILEARIAGNEQRLIISLNNLENGIDMFCVQNSAGLSALTTSIGTSVTSDYNGAEVKVTLNKIGKPPVGSGNDPSFKARYYQIDATDNETNQSIQVGVYKVFPPSE